MAKYRHREDGVDDLMAALARLHRDEGIAAAREALPAALRPIVAQMMEIENIGFTRATEVVLRTALEIQEAHND